MNREYNCKVSSKKSKPLLKNLQNTVGDYFFLPHPVYSTIPAHGLSNSGAGGNIYPLPTGNAGVVAAGLSNAPVSTRPMGVSGWTGGVPPYFEVILQLTRCINYLLTYYHFRFLEG